MEGEDEKKDIVRENIYCDESADHLQVVVGWVVACCMRLPDRSEAKGMWQC